MKSLAYISFLLVIAAAAFVKFKPANTTPPVEVITKSVDTIAQVAELPEPVADKIILEDSVSIWVDDQAILRPVRPYRSGEEFPLSTVPDTTAFSLKDKPLAVSWKFLTDIRYVLTYNKKIEMEVYAPIFPDTLKNLDGQFVRIRGYVIPFDEEDTSVALSAFPYAACFFCGKASPASVLTLRFKKVKKRYKLDDRRTFKGKLRLNYDDPEEFYYVLDDAEEY